MSSVTSGQRTASAIPWLVIGCGCAIAALTFGPRSAMGFFQLPMLADRGWDRQTFGLAMALQNLFWGPACPSSAPQPTNTGAGACWPRPACSTRSACS